MSPRRYIHEHDSKPVKPTLPTHGLNAKGLPTVPAELLLEILSYMQTMPIPCTCEPMRARNKERERKMTLFALFQTCRSLRSALLPFVWERIEVYTPDTSRSFNNHWCKNIATDLIEQLEIVTIREPSFASFVKTVSVAISGYSAYKVLREFARCLALMPNLQTIQIIDLLDSSVAPNHSAVRESDFAKAFKSYTFPSIKHVILSPRAHGLLRCFPNAQRVYLNLSWAPYHRQYCVLFDSCKKWLFEVAGHCPNVEEFGCSGELGQDFMELVISTLPKLRSVQIHFNLIYSGFISWLSELRNLEKIEFVVPICIKQLEGKREEAIRILEKSNGDAKKKMLVISHPEIGNVEVVKLTT
ncbi:hypothetical protein APHAL10511_004981 [Amanita phalloides]|nr:hypothetical protein APHAL10511_004981 [Amanita phalloides]